MSHLVNGVAGGYRVMNLAYDRKSSGVCISGNYPDGGAEQLIVVDVKFSDQINTANKAMTAGYYGVKHRVSTLTPWATGKSLRMGGMMVLDLIEKNTYLVQVRFYNSAGKCYTMQHRTDITESAFDAEVVRMNDWFAAKGAVEQQRDIVTAMQALL